MMGAVGNIMRLLENQFKNTKSYLQKIEDFENLYKNHKDLKKETIPVADKSTEKNIRIGISDIELSIDSI
jgi:predicted O-methyltransferase YrrM